MDACQEQIEAYLKQGHRQVVFSQFRTALEEFERRLKKAGIRVVRLDGSTPEKVRNEIKSNFYRAKGEVPKWDVELLPGQGRGSEVGRRPCPLQDRRCWTQPHRRDRHAHAGRGVE